MKPTIKLGTLLLCLAALGPVTWAQTAVNDPLSFRRAGEREFTLGGAGVSSADFDESFGGVNFSYGYYTSENQAWVLRQTINYTNPDTGRDSWSGSTRLAYDFHLAARGAFRPFVGVNAGGIYGEGVSDSWAAGLEAGAKFYVQPRTFIYAMTEYGWSFSRASALDDRFRDGQFNWGVGLGFNF